MAFKNPAVARGSSKPKEKADANVHKKDKTIRSNKIVPYFWKGPSSENIFKSFPAFFLS